MTTSWMRITHLPGYEWRLNENGHRETRPIDNSKRLEQIEMAQWCVAVLESHLAELDGDSRRAAYVAILEREKSALADLKQEMKP